jgi:hypothetical protein
MLQLRLHLSIIGLTILGGCSSVEPISDSPAPPVSPAKCNVAVHPTYQQAIKSGPIEELCIINGTSSGSFSHTVQTAINKHKSKACACGATNVYIQSRSDSGLDVATVSLVAFRYVEQQRPK